MSSIKSQSRLCTWSPTGSTAWNASACARSSPWKTCSRSSVTTPRRYLPSPGQGPSSGKKGQFWAVLGVSAHSRVAARPAPPVGACDGWSEDRPLQPGSEARETPPSASLIPGVGRLATTGNGVDDDGDGLIDEGVIFHTRDDSDPDATTRILALNVVPGSVAFQLLPAGGTTAQPSTSGVQVAFTAARRTMEAAREGEVLNGADDDNDGAVDEGFVQQAFTATVSIRNR